MYVFVYVYSVYINIYNLLHGWESARDSPPSKLKDLFMKQGSVE